SSRSRLRTWPRWRSNGGLFIHPSCIWRWVQIYGPELDQRCRPYLKQRAMRSSQFAAQFHPLRRHGSCLAVVPLQGGRIKAHFASMGHLQSTDICETVKGAVIQRFNEVVEAFEHAYLDKWRGPCHNRTQRLLFQTPNE